MIKCGALVETQHLHNIICLEKGKIVFKLVNFAKGGFYYTDHNGEAILINDLGLEVYKVSLQWLLKNILYALGINVQHKCLPILEQFIWNLGNLKLRDHCIHVLVARNLADNSVYLTLERYLLAQKSGQPILVISLAHLPPYFMLPAPHIVLTVYDLMIHDQSHALAFDIELILEKMGKLNRKARFSDGYRSALINGIAYTFTKKQAEVIEELDKAGKPMHQDEIMAIVTPDASCNRIRAIFRTNGKMHPAWNLLIKHDHRGYYWLEY